MIESIWPRERQQTNICKGLTAGLVAGLVASWTMNQFQALLGRLAGDKKDSESANPRQQNDGRESGEKKEGSGDEEPPATVKAASAISEEVFDHELTKGEKEAAGPVVHYAFGAATGAFYGAAAELVPKVTVGVGLPFGTAVWLLADEVTAPLVGLSKSPTEYPLSKHAYALCAHFVYGLTAETVRRAVRSAL